MVTETVVVPVRPRLSVIVSLTINVPGVLNLCAWLAAADVFWAPDPGSPKSQRYVEIVAPLNVLEPAELKAIVTPAAPVVGEGVITGSGFPVPTFTIAVVVLLWSASSRTVRTTMNVPAVENVCDTEMAELEVVPSPKSQVHWTMERPGAARLASPLKNTV